MADLICTQATEERLRKFGDVVFSYFLPTERLDEFRMPAHVLIFIYSGEMTVEDRGKKMVVKSGEYVFLRRDHEMRIHKYAKHGQPYQAISIRLERDFLKDYWSRHKQNIHLCKEGRMRAAATKVEVNPYVESLFASLKPFATRTEILPTDEFIRLKQEEAVMVLLQLNDRIAPTLFDFYDPWKIDILTFMESNYREDMTISEYAIYTGRSLATFKRDFSREMGTSPERWLTTRRLTEAYRLITERHERPSEVYPKVGFKNRSHFVKAFKQQYGMAPTQIV
jgi:AraC-like DNA-binding protein